MFGAITFMIIVSIYVRDNTGSYTYFEDQDFDYGPYKIAIPPYNRTFTYNILLNGHSHTNKNGKTNHDDGSLSAEENIKWHIAHGFNATIITGHNTLDSALAARDIAREKYNDTIKVILGMEWTSCRLHMNLIGISEPVRLIPDPTDADIKQIIDDTHKQGGLVVVNHRPWSLNALNKVPSREDFYKWGADYMEVASGDYFDLQTLFFVQDHDLGQITGVDMHSPSPVWSYTVLNAEEFTEEAIWAEIKAKRTSFIYDAYPAYGQERWMQSATNDWVQPFVWFGNMIRDHFFWERHGIWNFVDGFCGDEGARGVRWDLIWITFFWVMFFFVLFEIIVRGIIGFLIIKLLCQRVICKKKKNQKKRKTYFGLDQEDEEFDEFISRDHSKF